MENIALTSDFMVDIDETGAVCGVELLNANEQLRGGDDGKVVVVNEASGAEAVLNVA